MVTELSDSSFMEYIKSSKFVLVDCWAPWCGPCRRMGPIIDKLGEISQGEISVGKLNVDECPATSQKYMISSIPTLLIFKDGAHVDEIVGLDPSLTPERLKSFVLSL